MDSPPIDAQNPFAGRSQRRRDRAGESGLPDLASSLSNRSRILLLLLATLAAYSPVYQCGFVFDDSIYLTENPEVKDPAGLLRIWTSHSAFAYHPLTLTTFWLEYRLWGLNPFGYHIVNVILHALSAGLFFLLLRSLKVPGAFLAAALFGLHPVCVESVAWIAERKNVLSQSLVLASALFWLAWENRGKHAAYAGSFICFALSLLAKVTTAPFPIFILLIAWWRGVSSRRYRNYSLIPFFVAALGVGLLYVWIEKSVARPVGVEFEIPLLARCAIAGKAVWFYLSKLIWPVNLMTIYPRWEVIPGFGPAQLWPLSILAVITGLWFGRFRFGKGPFAASAIYLLALFPSLGFVTFSYMRFSFVADHFQYFACLAPIAGFSSWVASRFLEPRGNRFGIAMSLCFSGLSILAALTWNQCYIYQNNLTLCLDNVAKNPEGEAPRDHLGKVLIERGDYAAAYEQYRIGAERYPDSPLLRFGLATAAAQQGNVDLGIAHLRETLGLDSNYVAAHHNLAVALGHLGETEEAEQHFRETFRLDPDSLQANRDYGLFLMKDQRPAEAVEAFRRCLSLAPTDAPSRFNLGLALIASGRNEEAVTEFERLLEESPEEAQRIAPHLALAHRLVGIERAEAGDWVSAVSRLEKSLNLWPRTGRYRDEIAATRSCLEEAKAGRVPTGPER